MKEKTGVIKGIEVKTVIDAGSLFQLEVSMDDFDTYVLFGDVKEYMDFIDKEVEFTTRRDVVNGVVEEVINTIAVKSIIQTMDESLFDDIELDTASLIAETSKTLNVIDFDHKLLKKDDVALAKIILVVSYSKGKSKFAKWHDFTCLDCNSQVFNLRLFSNDDNVDEFANNIVGRYVMVDIKNDARYGFQVFKDMQLYQQEVQVPPEVHLASMRLKMIANRQPSLKEYVEKYNMIDYLKGVMHFEPGYHIVEMLSEIILIQALAKIYEGYDRDLLYRAVFASRGYLVGATDLSNPIVNYHRIITSSLKGDLELIRLLDWTSGVEEGDINKQAYLGIRKQVSSIMNERRGINEEVDINSSISSINSEYSGLF